MSKAKFKTSDGSYSDVKSIIVECSVDGKTYKKELCCCKSVAMWLMLGFAAVAGSIATVVCTDATAVSTFFSIVAGIGVFGLIVAFVGTAGDAHGMLLHPFGALFLDARVKRVKQQLLRRHARHQTKQASKKSFSSRVDQYDEEVEVDWDNRKVNNG